MTDRPRPEHADNVLDGNAVAGILAAAFGSEMTEVPGRCVHCATISLVSELRAYIRGPGSVLRCPACGGVVIRIVETPGGLHVDVRGASFLRFAPR